MKSAIRKNAENTVQGLKEIERIKLILIENQILTLHNESFWNGIKGNKI